MFVLQIGQIYKVKDPIIGYLDGKKKSVLARRNTLLTCIELKGKNKPWDAKYFLFDNSIIRVSWHSYRGQYLDSYYSNKKKFKKQSENDPDFFYKYYEEVLTE